MHGIRSWSDDDIDVLLAQPFGPPLSDKARAELRDRYVDGPPEWHETIEVGRNRTGAIGVFESAGPAGKCVSGYALEERDGTLELSTEISEFNASCGLASIQLVATENGAIPVMIDATGATDGRYSHELYDVIATGQQVPDEFGIACSVKALYADELALDWPEGAPSRETLQPVVLAIVRAGDIRGDASDVARAFDPVLVAPSNSAAHRALMRLLNGDRLSYELSDKAWSGVDFPKRLDGFPSVARLIDVEGESYVLAVGRDWLRGMELPPSFRLLGWNGDSYVLVAEGMVEVTSTFDRAELIHDQTQQ